MTGLLLINKPIGITSHDVVYRVRKVTGEKKVGHAGTLDPEASGLLIVGVGREATKKLGWLTTGTKKTYKAEITLGATSTTDDREGQLEHVSDTRPSRSELATTLSKFSGKITQAPPIYSAIKLNGKKAYDLARKGKKVKLEAREINVHKLKLIGYNYPKVEIECTVSAGTYIRALARDIGISLGTGAFLSALERTRIGDFTLKNATELKDLGENWKRLLV